MSPNSLSYLPELDGVRAISIAAVLALHGSYGLVKGGSYGVDLFFVLSGFLITRLLREEFSRNGRIGFFDFFVRRGLRIVPPLALALLLAWGLGGVKPDQAFLPVIFFYANFVDWKVLGSMTHSWSLSVEEQFYAVWPFLFAAGMRFGLRLVMAFAICAVIGAMLFRWWGLWMQWDAMMIYRSPFCRMDALAAGCMVAFCDWKYAGIFCRPVVCGFPILFLMLCLLSGRDLAVEIVFVQSLFAVLGAVFVGCLASGVPSRAGAVMAWTPLVYVGRRSYGIYVYHLPIFEFLEIYRIAGDWANLVVVSTLRVVATLLVVEVSYRALELPVLKLKKFFRTASGGVR